MTEYKYNIKDRQTGISQHQADIFLRELAETLVKEETEKCQSDPYYFMTKYVTINGEPYIPAFSKELFNG